MTVGPYRARLLRHAIFLAALSPATLRAQEWTLDAYAGRASHDAVAARIGTGNAVLGVRRDADRGTWLYLSAAAPFTGGDPAWAAGGAGRRWMLYTDRAAAAGLDLAAHLHGYRDPVLDAIGGGATLEALPRLEATRGRLGVELSSGWVQAIAAINGESESRGGHRTAVRLAVRPRAEAELAADLRYLRVDGDGYPFAGVSAVVPLGRAEAWGRVGQWLSDALPGTAWAVGSSLRAGERISVWASVQGETSDPIYWNTGRTSWSVGISRRLGRVRARPRTAPQAAAAANGAVVIRVPASERAGPLFVAGDFSAWTAVPMRRSGEEWVVRLALAPGAYRYAFRTAEGEWFVPESAPGRTGDGMGGHSAVLLVH